MERRRGIKSDDQRLFRFRLRKHRVLEIALIIGTCVIMSRIAEADDESGIIWGSVTFLLCLAGMLVPLPFLRVFVAGVVAFVLMLVYKIIRK